MSIGKSWDIESSLKYVRQALALEEEDLTPEQQQAHTKLREYEDRF